jgi:hypothetical protein
VEECAARGPAVGPEGRKGRRIRRRQCKKHRASSIAKEQEVAAATDAAHYHPLTTATDWRRHCICVLAQDGGGPGHGLGAFESQRQRAYSNSTRRAREQCKEPKTGGLWAAGGFQTGRARGCPGLPLLDRGPRTKTKDKLILLKKEEEGKRHSKDQTQSAG